MVEEKRERLEDVIGLVMMLEMLSRYDVGLNNVNFYL